MNYDKLRLKLLRHCSVSEYQKRYRITSRYMKHNRILDEIAILMQSDPQFKSTVEEERAKIITLVRESEK